MKADRTVRRRVDWLSPKMIEVQQNKHQYILFIVARMRKRQSTITEEYSPTIRRRLKTNYLSLSLPGAIKLVDMENEPSNQTQSEIGKADEKTLEKVKQNYDKFVDNHQKIHAIIDEVDQIIRKRMETHEEGLLSVVRSEIDKMQLECKKIVDEYNQMIEAKNKETEIYNLKNQVQYFRHAALEYFNHNKKLVEQNKELKTLVKNKDSIIQELNAAVKKAAKKYLKQKAVEERKQKEQNEAIERKVSNFLQEAPASLYKIKMKTEVDLEKDPPSLPLESEIMREKSQISHRYSLRKHFISSNMTDLNTKKRLLTELPSTILNQDSEIRTMKTKISSKSKSFWRFDGKS